MTLIRLLFIACLLLPSAAIAGSNAYVLGGGVAGAVCSVYQQNTLIEDNSPMGRIDSDAIAGLGKYDPGANKTVCAVDFYIASKTGDVSAVSYQVEIWNMDGNNLGTAPTGDCVSNVKTGSQLSTTAFNQFDGLSCQLSNGSLYAIVITRSANDYDGSNYLNFGDTATSSLSGAFTYYVGTTSWQYSTYATFDVSIKIYTQ